MDMREWTAIPGTNGQYWASPDGFIKGKRGLLSPAKTPKGYLVVGVKTDESPYNKFVHRLIARTFLGPIPPGHEINHKDGNKSNNSVSNLEYCTSSENKKHAFRAGLKTPSNLDRRGFDSPMGKAVVQISPDGSIVHIFGSARDAARKLGVNTQCITEVCRGGRPTAYGFRWQYQPETVHPI